MITANELDTLQAFLATMEAERLIGPTIGGKFDANLIWKALETLPKYKKLVDNINQQIIAMDNIIVLGQALDEANLPLHLQLGMSAAIDYKKNLEKLLVGV